MLGKPSLLFSLAVAACPAFCDLEMPRSPSRLSVRDELQVPRPDEFIRRAHAASELFHLMVMS